MGTSNYEREMNRDGLKLGWRGFAIDRAASRSRDSGDARTDCFIAALRSSGR